MADFLHERRDFDQLLAVVADERGLDPMLVEKDYWIMHCLWGLQAQGFQFELKGGTSLSKGFGVIHRFSEDIDIRIEPPDGMDVKTGRNQDKPAHVESRRAYYDALATRISIPNRAVTISSWALDVARERGVAVGDNRAVAVPCYAPTHTFVEKLQTISTKYRRLDETQAFPANFLRHYYDVYCLLGLEEVRTFMNTPAYQERKSQRFRTGDEQVIARNPAFLLADAEQRQRFAQEYRRTAALYYQGQPDFDVLVDRIHQHIELM